MLSGISINIAKYKMLNLLENCETFLEICLCGSGMNLVDSDILSPGQETEHMCLSLVLVDQHNFAINYVWMYMITSLLYVPLCVYVYTRVCGCAHLCRYKWFRGRPWDVFFCCFLPLLFETGSFTDLEFAESPRMAESWALGVCLFSQCPQSTGLQT